MQDLNTQPNFGTPGQRYVRAFTPGDDFYEALIAPATASSRPESPADRKSVV